MSPPPSSPVPPSPFPSPPSTGIEVPDGVGQGGQIQAEEGVSGVGHVVVFVVAVHDGGARGPQQFAELRQREPLAVLLERQLLGQHRRAGDVRRGHAGAAHRGHAAGGVGRRDQGPRRQRVQVLRVTLREAGDAIRGRGVVGPVAPKVCQPRSLSHTAPTASECGSAAG